MAQRISGTPPGPWARTRRTPARSRRRAANTSDGQPVAVACCPQLR